MEIIVFILICCIAGASITFVIYLLENKQGKINNNIPLKVYDKVKWHTEDASEPISKEILVNYFKVVFRWLHDKNMITEEGLEEMENIDGSSSVLHTDMVTQRRFVFRKML